MTTTRNVNLKMKFEYQWLYHIALNFRGSLISRIFNCSQKYFNESFWHAACSVRVQRVHEIISMKSSKIAICENLDPRKFSAIRYTLRKPVPVRSLKSGRVIALEGNNTVEAARLQGSGHWCETINWPNLTIHTYPDQHHNATFEKHH